MLAEVNGGKRVEVKRKRKHNEQGKPGKEQKEEAGDKTRKTRI